MKKKSIQTPNNFSLNYKGVLIDRVFTIATYNSIDVKIKSIKYCNYET